MARPRIAFVVQRVGRDVNGGAESVCLSIARAMTERWDIEIVTTCAREYGTWSDFYPPGVDDIDGVTVRRFPVDEPRDPAAFDRLSRRFRRRIGTAPLAEQEAWMRAQGPMSTSLLTYIRDQRDAFERFFFFTYLYATTYFGLPLVADKALLVPFAHDEWPIHAPMFDALFAGARGIVFSTPEERAYLERRFPNAGLRGPTVGTGIALPVRPDPERFRAEYDIRGPFVLYLGRIDRSKGLERLLSGFANYKHFFGDDLTLALAGRSEGAFAEPRSVRALGYIAEERKFDALAAADVVIMPSEFESLSLVLLEAWMVERPVLVTAASAVLVGQTRRAGGGLWFASDAEFTAALALLRGPDGALLGRSGRAFVERTYPWSHVVEEYDNLRRL